MAIHDHGPHQVTVVVYTGLQVVLIPLLHLMVLTIVLNYGVVCLFYYYTHTYQWKSIICSMETSFIHSCIVHSCICIDADASIAIELNPSLHSTTSESQGSSTTEWRATSHKSVMIQQYAIYHPSLTSVIIGSTFKVSSSSFHHSYVGDIFSIIWSMV